jgi:hypothetical protein
MSAMDRDTGRSDIERFKKLIDEESGETRREALHRLLAEEEAKLAAKGTKHKEPVKEKEDK